MSLRFSTLPVAFRALTALALVYSIFWWSVGDLQAAFDLTECLAAARLVGCSLVLALVGDATISLVTRCTSRFTAPKVAREESKLPHLPFVSRAILTLCVGQIVMMMWVFARSALSGVGYYIIGRQLPISSIEIWALAIGALIVTIKTHKSSKPQPHPWQIAGLLLVLVCLITPLAFRDLPRTVALSSDPDQHAFWASQVFKLGIVPWDQGLTGVGPFGYPAGFAVLNAIWMTFSGFSAVEIVTIQPMLQFLLSVVTCAAYSPLLLSSKQAHHRNVPHDLGNAQIILAALSALALYWFVLPYGLQGERFHGEGTARLSCSLLSALILLAWVAPAGSALTAHERSLRLLFVCVAVALLATINPLSAFLPGILVGCIGLDYCWNALRSKQVPIATCVVVGCAAIIGIIIGGEPYFVTHAAKVLSASGVSSTEISQPAAVSSPLAITLSTTHLKEWLSPARIASYLLAGTYINNPVMTPAYLLFTVAGVVWSYSALGAVLRWLVALGVCGLTAFTFIGLGVTGTIELPLYLIQPYVVQSVYQCGAILVFVLVMPMLVLLYSTRGAIGSASVGILVVSWFCLPSTPLTARTGVFNVHIRGGYCGTMACLSDGDQAAFSFIEQLGHRITQQYPTLSYATAPKILILGIPADLGGERWVFPAGAARALPLVSSLPIAFFYGRGHPDWTFENYQARVCQTLDFDWLKKRNVRYLFLSKHDPGCMKRRREIVRQSKVIFEQQGSRVLQLF